MVRVLQHDRLLFFFLFFFFLLFSPACFRVFLPDSRSLLTHTFIHPFLRLVIHSFRVYRVYPLHLVPYPFLAHILSTFFIHESTLPATCHSFSSLCCNSPSFSAMPSQHVPPLRIWNSLSTATQMVPLTLLPLAVQALSKSPMALQEVCHTIDQFLPSNPPQNHLSLNTPYHTNCPFPLFQATDPTRISQRWCGEKN